MPVRRWTELKALVLRHFRPMERGSLYEQWLSVTQEGSVEEYRRRFIQLAAPLEGVSEDVLLASFIRGLEEKVKVELRVWDPKTLEKAMEWAVRIEAKINLGIGPRGGGKQIGPRVGNDESRYINYNTGLRPFSFNKNNIQNTSQNSSSFTHPSNSRYLTPNPPSPFHDRRAQTGGLKRLTDKELQEKRAKGLCFRCDEKWNINHQCKRRELSVLLVNDDEEALEEAEMEAVEQTEDENIPPTLMGISLNSVVGIDNPKTMKLLGRVKGQEVVVMIDPGATHNFISETVVKKIELPVVATREFGVTLGNGESVKGMGKCHDVLLQLETMEIREDFYPLDLGNSDLILGIQWLEKLGPVTTNWKLQTMRFKWEDRSITL